MSNLEGVVKFRQSRARGHTIQLSSIVELRRWREVFFENRLIGQVPDRYNGAGFGNVSQRTPQYDRFAGQRSFVITATQTGHKPGRLALADYSLVLSCYPDENRVISSKLSGHASSESMTHGVIYGLDDAVRFVFHSHSPEIWKNRTRLRLPSTRETVEYGTPEMAHEVERLFRETDAAKKGIFAMGGHEDGIVTFGRTAQGAGRLMLDYLMRGSLTEK